MHCPVDRAAAAAAAAADGNDDPQKSLFRSFSRCVPTNTQQWK